MHHTVKKIMLLSLIPFSLIGMSLDKESGESKPKQEMAYLVSVAEGEPRKLTIVDQGTPLFKALLEKVKRQSTWQTKHFKIRPSEILEIGYCSKDKSGSQLIYSQQLPHFKQAGLEEIAPADRKNKGLLVVQQLPIKRGFQVKLFAVPHYVFFKEISLTPKDK